MVGTWLARTTRCGVSHWPAGIFRRAFIRAYALAIGLDPDVIVREFLECYPDPVEDCVAPDGVQPGDDQAAISAGPPMRARYRYEKPWPARSCACPRIKR